MVKQIEASVCLSCQKFSAESNDAIFFVGICGRKKKKRIPFPLVAQTALEADVIRSAQHTAVCPGGEPPPRPESATTSPQAPIYTRGDFRMGKVRFQLNLAGLNEVMKSPGIQAQLQAAGQAVAGAANGNYGIDVHEANWIAVASVYPADRESAKKNAKDNELLKALGAAGLPMSK